MAEAESTALTEDEAWEVVLLAGTPPSRVDRAAVAARTAVVATVRQLPRQIQRSLIIGGVAFGLGYVFNVWLLGYQYDGYRTPPGAPVTGQGSRLVGGLFWMLLSAAVTSVVSYRLRVGGERFRADVVALPGRARRLFTEDRTGAGIHALWGACAGFVAALLMGTALPLLGGLVIVGGLMTFARPLVVGLVGFGWRAIAARIAPTRSRPPRPGAIALAATGGMVATVLAQNVFPTDELRLLGALVAAGAAFLLARRKPSVATAAAVVVGALALLTAGGFDRPAAADDGGAIECPGRFWPFGCPGAGTVLDEALLGALASLLGALIGDAAAAAALEGEDDESEDGCGGMCELPPGGDDDEYEVVWEKVEIDPDPVGDAGAWKSQNPGRSLKEYDAERAARRIEESRKAAYAKAAEIDRLAAETEALKAKFDKMQADVDAALASKPWSELTNAQRQSTKKTLISTMTARGVPKAEIERTVAVLESDSGMTPGAMMLYVLGEVVAQTPGETWKATTKTLSDLKGDWDRGTLGLMAKAYAEDVASGQQRARLASPFTTAYEYYKGKTWQEVKADYAEVGRLTGSTSLQISEGAAKQFLAAIDKLHEAQVSGNAPGVAQPVAKFLGGELSEELLTVGLGKALDLGKAGLTTLAKGYEYTKAQRLLTRAEELAEARRLGSVPTPEIKDYVKAPHGTAIDTPEKLRQYGALEEEAKAAQAVADEHGVVLEMRPGGEDRAKQLATGNVGQKGQYNHNNTVKAEDLELGVGFRDDDVGLAGGLTDGMYAKLQDPKYFGSLSPSAQKRARERMEEFVDRAEERAALAKGKFERVPDEFSASGRKTVVQQRVRDQYGVDRHPQTGRPDTGDWDIGDIRLPDRAFFQDKFGNPLTDLKALRADQEKYNAVIKDLMAKVSANGTGSIRHPGGYWKPKVKIKKNPKTGKIEINCADVKTNRRINQANKLGGPNSKANLRFAPGQSSPTASYNPTGKPRYDVTLPGEGGSGVTPSKVVGNVASAVDLAGKAKGVAGLRNSAPPPPPPKSGGKR